ncbi:MAG TPA: hypothetical protein VGO40_17635 [Longimicrobium sp.]|jgi:hypothetical protein|nr:hypothetical protein [Longimicrobium sp.]
MKLRTLFTAALAAAPLALAACSDSSTGTTAPGQVQLRFGVASGARALKSPTGARAAIGGPLVVTGTNGSLSITEIRVVVSKFKLKGLHDQPCAGTGTGTAGGTDDSGHHEAEECEFEGGPLFLDLPLDGSQLTVATGTVPPGTYDRVRFKVKNLDLRDDDDHEDDADSAEAARVTALFQQIRAQFSDWPAKASMRVTGSFTPTGGAARPFTAYLNAEVKLQLPISPPLVVTEGSSTGQVAVVLDPAAIFRNGANVIDLSQFNGRLGEFKSEAGRGFHGEGHHGNGHD